MTSNLNHGPDCTATNDSLFAAARSRARSSTDTRRAATPVTRQQPIARPITMSRLASRRTSASQRASCGCPATRRGRLGRRVPGRPSDNRRDRAAFPRAHHLRRQRRALGRRISVSAHARVCTPRRIRRLSAPPAAARIAPLFQWRHSSQRSQSAEQSDGRAFRRQPATQRVKFVRIVSVRVNDVLASMRRPVWYHALHDRARADEDASAALPGASCSPAGDRLTAGLRPSGDGRASSVPSNAESAHESAPGDGSGRIGDHRHAGGTLDHNRTPCIATSRSADQRRGRCRALAL